MAKIGGLAWANAVLWPAAERLRQTAVLLNPVLLQKAGEVLRRLGRGGVFSRCEGKTPPALAPLARPPHPWRDGEGF